MRWLKYLILGLVCIILGFFAVFVLFNPSQLESKDDPYYLLIVTSGSMEPTIKVGSIVVVKKAATYGVGDIISFSKNGNSKDTTTHRINALEANQFITKGDGSEDPDIGVVKEDQVLGKVLITVPYVGYLADFAKKPQGLILLVIVPATIIIYEELKIVFSVLKMQVSKLRNKPQSSQEARHSANGINKAVIIVPLVGSAFIFMGLTASFFSDTETSYQNSFAAGTFTPLPTSAPIAQTLVINEVLPDTSCWVGNKIVQWIEIYNGYSTSITLQDYKITDGVNTVALVNAHKTLASGAFILLAHDTSFWGTQPRKCYDNHGVETANLGTGNLNLNPPSKTLQILDSGSVVIDTVKWGNATTGLDIIQNQSLERDPDGKDSALNTNFEPTDFVIRSTPQPGL